MVEGNAGRPPASGNKTLVIILLVIGIPCLAMVVLGIVGAFSCYRLMQNTVMPMISCSAAYEEVREAIFQYAKDHDGQLPNAATWEDDVRSYYAKVDLLSKENKNAPSGFRAEKMPIDGPWGCKIGENEFTGMAFNSDLSGKKLADITNPYGTVLLFEVRETGKNLHMPYRPRSKADAPKLFGESRDWMYIHVEGTMPFNRSSQRFETAEPTGKAESSTPDEGDSR